MYRACFPMSDGKLQKRLKRLKISTNIPRIHLFTVRLVRNRVLVAASTRVTNKSRASTIVKSPRNQFDFNGCYCICESTTTIGMDCFRTRTVMSFQVTSYSAGHAQVQESPVKVLSMPHVCSSTSCSIPVLTCLIIQGPGGAAIRRRRRPHEGCENEASSNDSYQEVEGLALWGKRVR